MKMRGLLCLVLAGCGAPNVPPPPLPRAPVPTPTASADTGPEVSPFQPAVDALAAQHKVDDQWTEALVASDMKPRLDAPLASIQRGAPFGLALDSTVAAVAAAFTMGARDCDGVVGRFCPSRTFACKLESRKSPDDQVLLRGSFVDGKLYALHAEIHLPSRSYKPEEDRVVIAAFDATVERALGKPVKVTHNDPFMSDAPPYESTVSYGDALRLRHTRSGPVTVDVLGASRSIAEALEKKDDELTRAEAARKAEAERKKLCTCAHVRIGDVWPHDRGYGMRTGFSTRYRVLSVSPATCSATVEVMAPHGSSGGHVQKSCTGFVDPPPCIACGRQ